MQVQEYIKQLLFDHNCVILPDFGGFVANRYPSRVNLSQLRVEPPRKGIAFNRNLKNTDGLLADYIAQKEEVSFETSAKWIAEYVENLNQTLQNRKFAEIKGLGDFYLNSENNLVFVPDANANFLKESYGLFPISLKPTNIESQKIIERNEPVKQKANSSKINYRRMSVGALLLIIPAVLTLLFYNSNLQNNPNLNISNIFSFLASSAEVANTSIPEPTNEAVVKNQTGPATPPKKAEESNANIESADITNTETQVANVNNETNNLEVLSETSKPAILYHIIGGSFSVPSNAENFLLELKSKGYPAYEAGRTKRGLIMIGYDKFSDEVQANQQLNKIHNTENKQAWIYLQNQ